MRLTVLKVCGCQRSFRPNAPFPCLDRTALESPTLATSSLSPTTTAVTAVHLQTQQTVHDTASTPPHVAPMLAITVMREGCINACTCQLDAHCWMPIANCDEQQELRAQLQQERLHAAAHDCCMLLTHHLCWHCRFA